MPKKTYQLASGQLALIQGDITSSEVDALVNAANSGLRGGGGVDGAIHKAAGPELLRAGRRIVERDGPLAAGQAVITPGYNLSADWVIHTVGPVWHGGGQSEDDLLAAAYRNSMRLAEENGLTSLAFPAISCGVFGFPVERAASIALKELRNGLERGSVQRIEMYVFSSSDFAVFEQAAERIIGGSG